jgi:hypothetical protein
MATTKTDATNTAQPAPTSGPTTGEVVTGKDAEQAVADFLANKRAPEGVSISRDLVGAFVVRKV